MQQGSPYNTPRPVKKSSPWKGWIISFVLGMIVALCGVYGWEHRSAEPKKKEVKRETPVKEATENYGNNPHEGEAVRYPGKTINYALKFNDLNSVHQHAAKQVGLKAIPMDRKEVEQMRSLLVRVNSGKNYVVDPLTHSVPYLCPGAKAELDRIGEEFADILKRNNLPHYQFIITSILRTQEDVNSLRRGNGNASENSCHCYGTTFDITYTRFEKADRQNNFVPEDNLMLVLGQALLNEQRAGRIYVKYERKQACFHITSRV